MCAAPGDELIDADLRRGRCEGVCVILGTFIIPCVPIAVLAIVDEDDRFEGWVILFIFLLLILCGCLCCPCCFHCCCAKPSPKLRGFSQGAAMAHCALGVLNLCWVIPVTFLVDLDTAECQECKRDPGCNQNKDGSPCSFSMLTLRRIMIILLWIISVVFVLVALIELRVQFVRKHSLQQAAAPAQQEQEQEQEQRQVQQQEQEEGKQQVQRDAVQDQAVPGVPVWEMLTP